MIDLTSFACFRPRQDSSAGCLRSSIHAAAAFFALGTATLAQSLPPADGPVVEPLSLKAVIALALQNNGEIKGTDLAKFIELERINSARQAFDLQLDGGYLYRSVDTPQNAQEYAATGGGGLFQPPLRSPRIFEERNHSASLGLSKKFETGTIMELGTTTRVLDNTLNRGATALFNPEWETFTGLTLTQPLLRDWGTQANTAQIRIAQANARVADLEWQSRTAQVVAEVMRRYYDVIFTLENLAVQRESIALAEKLRDDTLARGREGVAAGNDVMVAEAGVYQRMEDALEAEMLYIERQNALQLLFKTPEEVIAQGSRIQPVDRLRATAPVLSRATLVNTALAERYEVRQSEELIHMKSAELDYATNQARPRLDLVASGGFHGLDDDFGSSYSEAADSQGPEWSAGIQFSMPLNQDNLKAQRRAAQDEKTRAYIRRGEARLRVALEVDTVFSRLQMNGQRLAATRKSREAAAQTAEAGLKRLNEGVTTSFEVLQLQKDFSDARSRELAALADMNKSIVDLQLATGTLLQQQGVELVSRADETRRQYAPVPVVMIGEDEPAEWQSGDDPSLDETPPAAARAKRPSFSKAKRH
jgi:outer membrane protein TolC